MPLGPFGEVEELGRVSIVHVWEVWVFYYFPDARWGGGDFEGGGCRAVYDHWDGVEVCGGGKTIVGWAVEMKRRS